ncbi:MAG: site-specific DNA-methyltransferase [Rikenellaceae bacterium]|nr:site-specific DNA-methyltransferase [Rikenellaceae bacterium]
MRKFAEIIEKLGKPYYTNDTVLLYNMDCMKGLSALAETDLKIDSTVTSPPYNIGKEYEKVLPIDTYIDWLVKISDYIYNITQENGSYMLNVGYVEVPEKGKAVPISYLLWDRLRFYFNQEIIWNYGAGVSSKKYLSPRNEKVLWYVKDRNNYTFNLDDIRDPDVKYPNQKKNGKLRCNSLGKNPSDVWQIAKVTSGANRSSIERTPHPAQFPVDLITRIILGFTNENELILDPFMGSGTTAETCLNHNRRCLGFEINEKYCEITANRLEKNIRDTKLVSSTQTLFPL